MPFLKFKQRNPEAIEVIFLLKVFMTFVYLLRLSMCPNTGCTENRGQPATQVALGLSQVVRFGVKSLYFLCPFFFPSWNLMLSCRLDYCHGRRKLYKSIHDMGKLLLFRIYWIHLENASSVLSKATHPSKSLNYVPVKQNIRECVYIYTYFSFGYTWAIKVHSHP